MCLSCTALWLAGSDRCWGQNAAANPPATAEVRNASIKGGWDGERASLLIQAELQGLRQGHESAVYSATFFQAVRVTERKLLHRIAVQVDVLRGQPQELVLELRGKGEVSRIAAPNGGVMDWAVRQGTNGARSLVVRFAKAEPPLSQISLQIFAETTVESWDQPVDGLTLMVSPSALSSGYVRIDPDAGLEAVLERFVGLSPVEPRFLPESLSPVSGATTATNDVQAYRFHGVPYELPLKLRWADPEAGRVVLNSLRLVGELQGEVAAFTLSAVAKVQSAQGGEIALLGGRLALTGWTPVSNGRLRFEAGRYVASFDRAGEFPIEMRFHAGVVKNQGWSDIDVNIARSVLPKLELRGLPRETQFRFQGAPPPEAIGETFASFLPPSGELKLQWREAGREAEGVLFFSVEALSQIQVRPGLMTQIEIFEYKVMQGELKQVSFLLRGVGEVTRVQGASVLSWVVSPLPEGSERRLTIQLNQSQKDQFSLQVQAQTPLGLFPLAVDMIQVKPEGALRTGGFVRLLNEGAVRLEVLRSSGLSQISPEQFPQTDSAKALVSGQGSQIFAYRFSGDVLDLRFQADNILPEISASQVLLYHYGENELSVELDLDLEVREAPLRELVLRVPRGFAVARLNAVGLTDYFLTETPGGTDSQLRLVYSAPVLGRQLINLSLEQNRPPAAGDWTLPRIDIPQAKSVRGHLGVKADLGFRLSPGRLQGVSEVATAFFPKKTPGLQAAARIQDALWSQVMSVERLPQSVQADVFHLFSLGEGIANGSSLIHYLIAGAPVSAFRVGLSNEYLNVEFSGKDLRSWQKVEGGYVVQLHSPVSGAYPLLVTFERPFRSQGERVTFGGARPLDAQSEQGHTVIVSSFPFQAQPPAAAPGWMVLEPAEIPSEYRLFFDAPVLAAYRYSARPADLALDLKPLVQGETVNQVVDRGMVTTRISKDGQVITDLQYFVKSKGVPHLRLTVPAGMQLWSVTINGNQVVPVQDGAASVLPMPQQADPNAVNDIRIKIAARSASPRNLTLSLPALSAPVLLEEWRLEPESGRRLVYRSGSIAPADRPASTGGASGLARWMESSNPSRLAALAGLAGVLILLALWVMRVATAKDCSRFSSRHVIGGIVALVGFAGAFFALGLAMNLLSAQMPPASAGLRFLVPVQPPDRILSVEVQNLASAGAIWSQPEVWALLALAVALWFAARRGSRDCARGRFGVAVAWVVAAAAAGRSVHPGMGMVVWLMCFVAIEMLIPCLRTWLRVPAQSARGADPQSPTTPSAPAIALWLVGFFLSTPCLPAAEPVSNRVASARASFVQADQVTQEVRVVENSAMGTVRVRWQAQAGQVLPLLLSPGVMTGFESTEGAGRLVEMLIRTQPGFGFRAEKTGLVELEFRYQVSVARRKGEPGFVLPVVSGVVNRVGFTLAGLDVDLQVPTAISSARREAGADSAFDLVLPPGSDIWIGWKPRSRDTRRERAVLYADWIQLLQPGAGVVDALHQAQIRPAQGEVDELLFDIPAGATIADVTAPSLLQWRFDPAQRKLRVILSSAQSKPFQVQIHSQFTSTTLPYTHRSGLVGLVGAAGQVGLLGVATSSEVQLDDVKADSFAPINLEDFPPEVLTTWRGQSAGTAIRRAFRFSQLTGELVLQVSQVAPDVRVESQQTLSLGDDRTVLAVGLEVDITRSGIFKLSFVLPVGFDVESISGEALSHWTELKAEADRVITLHLKGRTEGKQRFAITLAGAGISARSGWTPPRLVIRESEKQRGSLVLIPEQGLKLQVSSREGLTQLDPARAGLRQKGVLAFRLLQANWNLVADVERVEAWTQVTSFQSVVVAEARLRVGMNLVYDIDNAGTKTLRLALPLNAENVQFTGEQVADFVKSAAGADPGSGRIDWEVRLHRRMIGKFVLQLHYQLPLAEATPEVRVLGVQARDVNLQRGFLALQTKGRLQLEPGPLPTALQPAEWQSIPANLRQGLEAEAASHVFRLVEPGYELSLRLTRHEVVKLLPARVHSATLTSVVSDDGTTLTRVRLQITPGDKQLLPLTLPERSRFWFAFVSQNSVWPWKEKDQLLIPLERASKGTEPIPVEFYYLTPSAERGSRSLDLALLGPKFDLPLEQISWNVFLNPKWQVHHWGGSLELSGRTAEAAAGSIDLASYERNEITVQRAKSQEAEQFLSMANSLLEKGNPEQARRALQSAFGLSQHDNAFNEDARVQLHNLKTQQALVGLNLRQARVAGDATGLSQVPSSLRDGPAPAYTQQEAKTLLERNSAEDAAAQRKLVERLIQQQETVLAKPAAIHASLPEQGQRLSFTRALQIDAWTDLKITLRASESARYAWLMNGMMALVLLGLVGGARWGMARMVVRKCVGK
ncbi:MAG: phage tail tape measure protein [Verrucomicrobiales bacterium]|nr:phage tail tape measure protein [Verrucomicrobiales bacterium]